MSNDSSTIICSIVTDIDLRFTKNGNAVASFRAVQRDRRYDRDSGQWADAPKDQQVFFPVSVWSNGKDRMAEIVAESTLPKGTRIEVTGMWVNGGFYQKDGVTHQGQMEFKASSIRPLLDAGQAITVSRPNQRDSQPQSQPQVSQQQADPWASNSAPQQADPWATAGASNAPDDPWA